MKRKNQNLQIEIAKQFTKLPGYINKAVEIDDNQKEEAKRTKVERFNRSVRGLDSAAN